MKKGFLLLFLIICFANLKAQTNSVKPENTSIIIQFADTNGIHFFKNSELNWFSDFENIYKDYNIYKANLKEGQSAQAVIDALKGNPKITLVQQNRKLERRNIEEPNDEYYPQQWNMKKIQMDSAWTITTGGPTTAGDTVVTAIIDAGFDTSHPDFGHNLFINRNEIPGDTIDNDGDGYAGNYYGWSTYFDDGTIMDSLEYARHGVEMAGIIGAVGNNEIGMAGISWSNKFIPIIGGGDEANAIKSYGYVITQKKLYLETNGQKGANIISVNSSWGRSNVFPFEAPIWCSLYDSMGKYGILSANAVSNTKADLDIIGDMPTLCPSKFKISVTNTDEHDELHGGYGAVSVDLGAPGTSILSAHSSYYVQRYGTSNGTSYAAPHVAGLISLMYSAACDNFIQFSKQYPDSAALLIRDFILGGVDLAPDLQGVTITGGRLNAYNSLLLLKDWCNGEMNLNPFIPNNDPNLDSGDDDDSTIVVTYPKDFTLFPNPGIDNFTIKGKIKEISRINILSIDGSYAKTIDITDLDDNQTELKINFPFAKSLYIIELIDSKNNVINRFKWLNQ